MEHTTGALESRRVVKTPPRPAKLRLTVGVRGACIARDSSRPLLKALTSVQEALAMPETTSANLRSTSTTANDGADQTAAPRIHVQERRNGR